MFDKNNGMVTGPAVAAARTTVCGSSLLWTQNSLASPYAHVFFVDNRCIELSGWVITKAHTEPGGVYAIYIVDHGPKLRI